ncbi:reverse transcriptase domain-containing protein [Tanacetum coccineum]
MQMDNGDGKCVGFDMDVGAAGRKAARSGVAAKRKEEKIMLPRYEDRSASLPAAEIIGGGTCCERKMNKVLRANGGVKRVNGNVEGANEGAPDFSTIIAQQLRNLLPAMLAQVSNRGNFGNQNGNVVNKNVQENVGKSSAWITGNWEFVHDMVVVGFDQKSINTYRGSFVGKALTWWNSQIRTLSQEVAVSMSWNDFKFMMIQEFCLSHETQKLESELWNHAMVKAGHAAYTDRFPELARLVPHLVTPESRMIERYAYGLAPQISGMVEAMEPKTIQKAVKDKNGRDDNKRTRTGNVFATTVNPVGRENTGMDWLSNYKAEIICHEKVVRIPLPDGKVLRVVGERPKEKARLLMSTKASDKKQEEIVVVRDFPEVFLDDLSGLPPIQEIKFGLS